MIRKQLIEHNAECLIDVAHPLHPACYFFIFFQPPLLFLLGSLLPLPPRLLIFANILPHLFN